ncbi:MAG: SDR family oxidoreductase [Pseudomonadota bacterium]
MSSNEKRILITGATGSLGTAFTQALAETGAKMVLGYHRNKDKALELKESIRGVAALVDAVSIDLTKPKEPLHLIERCNEVMGGIDVLIHCASLFEKTPLGSVTSEKWDEIIDADLKVAFFLAQAAAQNMKEKEGSMIFLSDVAVQKPYGSYLPYCIAKAGIEALVRGLARTLAPHVRVNAIAPYLVTRPNDMSDKGWVDLINKTPMRKPNTIEEIVGLVKWLVFDAHTTTGQVIAVDGGRLLR